MYIDRRQLTDTNHRMAGVLAGRHTCYSLLSSSVPAETGGRTTMLLLVVLLLVVAVELYSCLVWRPIFSGYVYNEYHRKPLRRGAVADAEVDVYVPSLTSFRFRTRLSHTRD